MSPIFPGVGGGGECISLLETQNKRYYAISDVTIQNQLKYNTFSYSMYNLHSKMRLFIKKT